MAGLAYQTSLDIANRALQHLRVRRIFSFSDSTLAAKETNFVYDKLRQAELRNNLWRFATKRTMLYALGVSTYLWTPPNYNAATSYSLGSIVVDAGGTWWQSKTNANLGNTPAPGNNWQTYFGPDSCQPFFTTAQSAPAAPAIFTTAGGSLPQQTYFVKVTYTGSSGETAASGESQITAPQNTVLNVTSPSAVAGATGFNVYVSNSSNTEMLQNSTPINLGSNWTEPTTGLIFGIRPPSGALTTTASPTISTSSAGFFQGDLTSFNGAVYLSLVNVNNDVPPTVNWLAVNGTIAPLEILYPLGVGPASDTTTRNAFRLPHGFLRQAPSSPKGAANPWLGSPRGNLREDWVFEGNYIVSSEIAPIMMRFVAEFVDVPDMDPMFCEMLAARIAEETGPLLVQDPTMWPEILANVQRHYGTERFKAVAVDAIEIGPVDPDLDDFITCRF